MDNHKQINHFIEKGLFNNQLQKRNKEKKKKRKIKRASLIIFASIILFASIFILQLISSSETTILVNENQENNLNN